MGPRRARRLIAALVVLAGCGTQPLTGERIQVVNALPDLPVAYVPVVYDDLGQPAEATHDSLATPKLYLWPNGRLNLTGLRFTCVYPKANGPQNIVHGWYVARVNALGWTDHGVTAGDLLTGSEFVAQSLDVHPANGYVVGDFPAATVTGCWFSIAAVSDSLLEGVAFMRLVAGSDVDTASTSFRLAHERWRN